MSWGCELSRHGRLRRGGIRHGPLRRGRMSAYPIVVLSVAMLLAGCGDPNRRGVPTFDAPSAPAVTDTGPAADASVSPGSTAAPAGTDAATPTAASPTSGTPKNPRYVFPVRGKASYHPTHSGYPATDVFADCGTPVVAVADGKVLEVSRVDRYSKSGPQGPDNGGRSVSLLGDDGVRYYGSHLTEVAAGVEAGVRVRAGQQLGTVGRTGNANNVCHLHFGISPPCTATGDWWIRRGVVWPAQFLDAWRKKSNRSPVTTVNAWHREHGCPRKP